MASHEDLNARSRLLLDVLLAEFPAWTSCVEEYGPANDAEAEPGSICLVVHSPAHPRHSLSIAVRGNFVEVAYSDARPPGPAEQIILVPDGEVEAGCFAVLNFVRDVIEERQLVVREPLGWITRTLRGDGCIDLASFRSASEVGAAPTRRYPVVYSWLGRFSRP
jgi:hypothetical protein